MPIFAARLARLLQVRLTGWRLPLAIAVVVFLSSWLLMALLDPALAAPRDDMSQYAPRIYTMSVKPDKIRDIIGPGGKTIRAIQEMTGAVIEVEDDGTVTVASSDASGAQAALERIEAMTASVQVGKIYKGRVTSIKDFGAFIEIVPGKDGLCHISELSEDYVSSVGEFCRVGDILPVKVILVDEQDRVKLSHKAAVREMAQPAN